ncbi:MAG: hypothetical protein AB2805_18275 [Candidatus Thiodiazotropha sp.]
MSINHYLLIKRESYTPAGETLSAYDSALTLLKAGLWPLWKHTRNRRAIRTGDKVAIYLSGQDNKTVIGTAQIDKVEDWNRATAKAYPLILDGEPASALFLKNHTLFSEPKPIQPRLNRLSFYKGGSKWGAAFMGGTRSLTPEDFLVLTQ